MAEPIEMPFGMWTRVGPEKHVLDKDPDPGTREEGILTGVWPTEKHCKAQDSGTWKTD